MAQPWQLAKAFKPRRSTKPVLETLPQINVNRLQIPRDHQTYVGSDFRFPHIDGMRINAFMVQFAHNNRAQTFKFKWIKTPSGWPRAAFICECGRPVIKIYLKHQNLGCHACCNAIRASQTRNKQGRITLKAIRLRKLLEFKSYMGNRNRQRLTARIDPTAPQQLNTKRLAHHRIQLPQHNYGTYGAMHWC